MHRRIKIVASTCALGIAMTAAAQAAQPELELVKRPAESFDRSIETHKLEVRYRELIERSRELGAAPKRDLIGADAGAVELRDSLQRLERRVKRAERARRAKRASGDEAVGGLAPGVSMATLEAIAECESGGDPSAVNAAGYYGKYQFDLGTWASVGGSGNPAEAPESEQDYRASLLYSRAGSSPWPVCGV